MDEEAHDPSATITVCIASIGRPSLLVALRSLEQVKENFPGMSVLVADDSSDGAAERLIQSGGPWRMAIEVHRVGSRNISRARNVCLDRADGAYLAFIDDDEWAHPLWLNEMLSVAAKYRADAVFGAVEARFPKDAPQWLTRSGIFQKKPGADGLVVTTGSTANALVRREAIGRANIRFNEALGRTGGEDTEFFYKLGKSGAILVACAGGTVYEDVVSNRLNVRHLWTRYTRGGYTYASVMTGKSTIVQRSRFLAGAAVKLVFASFAALVSFPIRRDRAFSYSLQACGHLGKMLYICGWPSPRPYS